MQETHSKLLVILLSVFCVFVKKGLPESRVENDSHWYSKNFKRSGGKYHYDTSQRTNGYKGNINSLVHAEQDSVKREDGLQLSAFKTKWLNYHFFINRPQSQQHETNDGQKSEGTSNQFVKMPGLNYPKTQQNNLTKDGSGDGIKAARRSNDILNRWLSKTDITKDKITDFQRDSQTLPGVTLNERYKIESSHRIFKRNVNTSEPTPAPPIFIPPPPPLPPVPSFNIPPVCSGKRSCSGRCMANTTQWRTDESLECYCDSACYEIFNDCCTDYTKYCGGQEPSDIPTKKFHWTCEPLGHYAQRSCTIGEGLWMVSRCAHDWPHDDIRSKCENSTNTLNRAFDLSRYIPVVNKDVTFRNYFCAKCNRILGDLEFWPVEIKTNVIPPEHYNFTHKVNFLLSNGAEFPRGGPTQPKSSHPRRYCITRDVADSCPTKSSSDACTNGPVALISGLSSGKQYKNFECALCDDPQGLYACFPTLLLVSCRFSQPQNFLLNLDYKYSNNGEDSVLTVQSTTCDKNGLIYDDKLHECVGNFSSPSKGEDSFHILVWFAPSKDSEFTENDFKTIMKKYFGVEGTQVLNISIKIVPRPFLFTPAFDPTILYHLVSSNLFLTPEQSFSLLFKTDPNLNPPSLKLRSLIHFENPLSVPLNNISYTIIKTASRASSCITQKIYSPQDYTVLQNERVYIKTTYIAYKRSEYYGQINGNITICERYKPSNCKTTHTGLTKNDFVINSNLSLYYQDTGKIYNLGQYDVSENSISLCDLEKSDELVCASENSCAGRCSNHTEWRTEIKMRCSCDPDCYEVFNDCCSDYIRYCGAETRKETPTKRYNYTCTQVGHYDAEGCTVGHGLWMVTQCPSEWPHDTLRSKCEQPVAKLTHSSPNLDRYLPVLGHDNTTFRNMYCAICNGVDGYEPWPLDIETAVIPPENYNVTEKIRFLLTHAAEFPEGNGPWRPGVNQARRYCLNEIVDTCPLGAEALDSCMNGSVAVIAAGNMYFKNMHCASCHGRPSEEFSCFPDGLQKFCFRFFPQSFSLVFGHGQGESVETKVLLKDEKCGKSGMIFDDILQICRVNWLSPPEQNGQERFYVFAWLEPPRNSQNNSFTSTEFQDSLTKYLNVSLLQLFNINITNVFVPSTATLLLYLVSSTIVLTPDQSLELLTVNRNQNSNSSQTKLLDFIYFSEPFTLQMNGIPYTVAKTTSRPLACVGQITYTPGEYTLHEGERVFIPSTNKSYEKFEYFRENIEQLAVKRGNISVCEKLKPAICDGTVVLYTAEEYTVMVNLSIYVNKTSSLYHYGEYDILSNKSVKICEGGVFIITGARKTIRDDEALGYITFICFVLSIILLIFLLVTYILFPHLRTLPGKNLMNLAASLLFFEIFWLPSSFSEVRSDKPSCMAMAILEHYFLMASFVSMSVIAFHTCKVFARTLPAPKTSEGHERKLFCMYLAMVWLLPAVFVIICVVLDEQNVLNVGYGESEICWLTENNTYTYFVTIPIALLLLFNIIAFVITAVYLRQHGQNTAAKQATGNRQSNLSIYVRLSTLMGFTWLFGLLALVVKSTTVFWYFFVIFTSLQGVFVAAAFVINTKTLNLYRKGYKKHYNSGTPSTSRKVTTNTYIDTKL